MQFYRCLNPACGHRRAGIKPSTANTNPMLVCHHCGWTCLVANLPADYVELPERIKVNLQLSEAAWEWLRQTAESLGYVRAPKRPAGMYRFLDMLATLDYADARPDFMRDTDQWYNRDVLRQRCTTLSRDSLDALEALGRARGIYPFTAQIRVAEGRQTHIKGVSPLHSPVAWASPIFEAIGLRYLVPVSDIPAIPPGTWKLAPVKPRGQDSLIY